MKPAIVQHRSNATAGNSWLPILARRASSMAVLALAFGYAGSAMATIAAPVLFDFALQDNTVSTAINGMAMSTTVSGSGLGKTAKSSSIADYMTAVLHTAGYANSSVQVVGALGTATYTGEGYVWGNSLGTSNGATFNGANTTSANDQKTVKASGKDGFIINDNFGIYGKKYSQFTLKFINFQIDSVGYDWEIFPDATCPSSNNCSSLPDISLYADDQLINNTFATKRTVAETKNRTYAPQGLGTVSNIALNNVSTLEFRDWPAEIGIDNLKLTGHVVPEPASLTLMAAGMLPLTWLARRRQKPTGIATATHA